MGALWGLPCRRTDRLRRQHDTGDGAANAGSTPGLLYGLARVASRDPACLAFQTWQVSFRAGRYFSLSWQGSSTSVYSSSSFVRSLTAPCPLQWAGTASNIVFLIAWNVLAGEPWTMLQIVAGLGVFLGVAMATRPEQGPRETASSGQLRNTALLGLGAGFLSSVRLFLIQESSAGIGPGDAMVGMRVGAAAAVLLLLLVLLRGRLNAIRIPRGRIGGLVVLQVFLETFAVLALLHGSVVAGRIGAAVGFAVVPAASTIAARLFLGDAIGRRRGWWILFVVACVILATLAEGLLQT